ncbi:olfactory receptor 12D1-like [Spea bombifrons]|uniref:olfactory receptor 12D1-like n=1 Tax=Spea bombifrons TaxID=233779 RepID=UPI00234A2E79|nr:olfactory receptor 12D1-like [Spea bombifrons]
MEADWNRTSVDEFILVGLTDIAWFQKVLFVIFSFLYLVNLLGNFIIIFLVIIDPALHTPMYFLLANLSILDIFYASTTVPKMLVGLLMENTISIKGCITQLHFFHFLGCTEGVILAAMGYDRYVAICQPLRYGMIMDKRVCIQLVLISWLTGLTYASIHSVMTSQLPFCTFNKVRHFFCDVKPVIKLACTDIRLNEIMLTVVSGFFSTGTFLLTMISYCFIAVHLFKIQSSQGRRKAFSTCSSHLTIVTLFYGTAMCTYLGPASEDSIEKDKVAAILFTVMTPTLNPLIYALRNQEVKKSLRKFFIKSNIGRLMSC